MTNFVVQQILWTLSLLFFLFISYIAISVFSKFKKHRAVYEILLCLIVFSYMLAFHVNY
jgi:hypothetical protein